MSLNYVILVGRLVRDPEHRLTSSGIPVTTFTIAVDKQNRQQESQADFIRVTSWRRLAEICKQYLHKGKLVAVEGRLQRDQYESNGQVRESFDVVADNMQMLDRGQQPLSPSQEPPAEFSAEAPVENHAF